MDKEELVIKTILILLILLLTYGVIGSIELSIPNAVIVRDSIGYDYSDPIYRRP